MDVKVGFDPNKIPLTSQKRYPLRHISHLTKQYKWNQPWYTPSQYPVKQRNDLYMYVLDHMSYTHYVYQNSLRLSLAFKALHVVTNLIILFLIIEQLSSENIKKW